MMMYLKFCFLRGNILLFFFIVFAILSQLSLPYYFIDILDQLSFHIIYGGIFLIFILIYFKRYFASLICIGFVILLCLQNLFSCRNCNAFEISKFEHSNSLRVMTFNVNYLNQFEDFDNFYNLLLNEDPDIIQIQESNETIHNKLNTLNSIYPYNIGLDRPSSFWGSIILSKYPLLDIAINEHEFITATLIKNGITYKIIGAHLVPAGSQIHYNIALNQMENLKTLINKNKGNVILIGDLNMTPYSKRFNKFLEQTNLYTYYSLKKLTSTWPTFLPNFFGIQIDHVLFSSQITMINKKILQSFSSDHSPLLIDLIVKKL